MTTQDAGKKRIEPELEARLCQQAAVADLSARALSDVDPDELMREAVTLTADCLGVEYSKVLELLPDGKELLLRAGVGWQEGLIGRATVGAGTESQAGYTLLSDEPVIVKDLRTETRFSGPPLLHDHGVVSGLSVIIRGSEGPFGVMGAHTTERRDFTSHDVDFLRAVANLLAEHMERRRAEGALGDFLENAVVAIHSVDRDGVIIWANRAELALLGYDREEYIGHHVTEFHADKAVGEDLLRRLSAGEDVQAYQARLRCKDSSIRHVRIDSNVKWESGQFGHTRCFTFDITEQVQADEKLRESEARFRMLAEQAQDTVFRLRLVPEPRFEYVSPAVTVMAGYRPDELYADPEFPARSSIAMMRQSCAR